MKKLCLCLDGDLSSKKLVIGPLIYRRFQNLILVRIQKNKRKLIFAAFLSNIYIFVYFVTIFYNNKVSKKLFLINNFCEKLMHFYSNQLINIMLHHMVYSFLKIKAKVWDSGTSEDPSVVAQWGKNEKIVQ